jgi:Tn3 transposase DDE domain-containing protein
MGNAPWPLPSANCWASSCDPASKRSTNNGSTGPKRGTREAYPHLQPVLRRPINWALITPEYDNMVKDTTALRLGTAETEAILRRFTRENVQHPTYKALIELGKACRTVFLCRDLRLLTLRREIQEGLNVIENWNSANDFILFGTGGELATNRQEDQEVMMLALHLLQNCLVFIHTLMIQRVLSEAAWEQRLTAEDRRGLTPLMYSHISPYGAFLLDMHRRLDLERPVEAAHARHEQGAAQTSSKAVQPPHRTRLPVQQLALFNAAPESHD